jgi:hypothetical protein
MFNFFLQTGAPPRPNIIAHEVVIGFLEVGGQARTSGLQDHQISTTRLLLNNDKECNV